MTIIKGGVTVWADQGKYRPDQFKIACYGPGLYQIFNSPIPHLYSSSMETIKMAQIFPTYTLPEQKYSYTT